MTGCKVSRTSSHKVLTKVSGVLLYRWFDLDENSSGRLGSTLSTDAAVLRGAVGDVFGVVCQNLALMAVAYVIAFIYDWRMVGTLTTLASLDLCRVDASEDRFYSNSELLCCNLFCRPASTPDYNRLCIGSCLPRAAALVQSMREISMLMSSCPGL